jgi:hypothetical protein
MRTRITVSLLAVVLAFGAFGAPSASANGDAKCEAFSVTVKGFPDTCPPGMTMYGEARIFLNDLMLGPRPRPQLVTVVVSLKTIVGPVTVYKNDFYMQPGTESVVEIEVPVARDADRGSFELDVDVTAFEETLTIHHEGVITN